MSDRSELAKPNNFVGMSLGKVKGWLQTGTYPLFVHSLSIRIGIFRVVNVAFVISIWFYVGRIRHFAVIVERVGLKDSLLMGERTERFYVISLNAQCKVLGVKKISEGSLSEVSAYPRMVAEAALNYNAHSVLLCHNHPGGTCCPSPEDIQSTIQLQRMLR